MANKLTGDRRHSIAIAMCFLFIFIAILIGIVCLLTSRYTPQAALPIAILDTAVRFDQAQAECEKTHRDYKLAGLDAAKTTFLLNTTEIIISNNVTTPAVWMGGYFNMTSEDPYLIHWTDGRVSDAKKLPNGLFCQNIQALIRALSNGKFTILPIVRIKKQPACLTLFRGNLNNTSYQSFCMINHKAELNSIDNVKEKTS